jgi:hypothetical protein
VRQRLPGGLRRCSSRSVPSGLSTGSASSRPPGGPENPPRSGTYVSHSQAPSCRVSVYAVAYGSAGRVVKEDLGRRNVTCNCTGDRAGWRFVVVGLVVRKDGCRRTSPGRFRTCSRSTNHEPTTANQFLAASDDGPDHEATTPGATSEEAAAKMARPRLGSVSAFRYSE